MKMKKKIILLIISLVFLVFSFYEASINQLPEKSFEKSFPYPTKFLQEVKGETVAFARVIKIIDGDTIEIETGEKIRYIGIDTPETVDPRRPVSCFGKEAKDKNKELVEGKVVKLVKDISETDRYKRLLRYIWVGDIFVNDYLIREGYAKAATFPPDVKYEKQFQQAEKEARNANRGLWSLCRL